jgi:hypothetical protein
MKEYQYRILVYIDILGFSESISKSTNSQTEFDRIFNTITNLREYFESSKDGDGYKEFGLDTQVLQISDSLIISKLLHEQGGLFYLLQECSFAIHQLITFGFLCRGSIKYGKLYHENDLIFGEAFIDAYKAESKMTLPIIKFNKDLFELVKLFPGIGNIGNEEWELDFIKRNLIQLNNDEYYVDYFTDFEGLTGEVDSYEHYEKLRRIITEGLKLNPDSGAYLKYLWAAKEFNSRTSTKYGNEKIEILVS